MAFKELLPWSRKARLELGNPFQSMRALVETMERAFANPWSLAGLGSEWAPKVELEDRPKELIVHASLPGLSKDEISCELSEHTLTIRGEQSSRKARKHGREREQRARSFVQSFTLPVEVKHGGAKASLNKDVLTIELPKVKSSQVRRILIE